jgi:hypothetical protein
MAHPLKFVAARAVSRGSVAANLRQEDIFFMNINGIHGSSAATGVGTINPNVSKTPSSIPPAGGGGAASAQISAPGLLLAKLKQLSEQDPAKFKEITQNIADELHQAAQQTTPGSGSVVENRLGDRFAQAAQDGNLSALQPKHGDGDYDGNFSFNPNTELAQTLKSIRADALRQVHDALKTPTPGTDGGSSGESTPGTSSA